MVYLGIIKMHKSFSLGCKHTHKNRRRQRQTGKDREIERDMSGFSWPAVCRVTMGDLYVVLSSLSSVSHTLLTKIATICIFASSCREKRRVLGLQVGYFSALIL